jgi:hypothetical protein
MSNRKYGRTGINGVQTKRNLVCRICGKDYLGHHLTKECEDCRYKECLGFSCHNKIPISSRKQYCCTACREASPDANKMSLDKRVTETCLCGVVFPKYSRSGRHRYCSPECRVKYTRVGDRLRDNPELAKKIGAMPKPGHGLKGYKQAEDHLIKRLGTGAIRASKEELSLAPKLAKLGYRHTGEGSFWRRWTDGTLHNPDFVNEAERKVVEYFGSYWHAPAEADFAVEQWAKIGYNCLVIWDHEREAFLTEES